MNYLHSQLFLQLGFKLDSGRDSASKLLCGDLAVQCKQSLRRRERERGGAGGRRDSQGNEAKKSPKTPLWNPRGRRPPQSSLDSISGFEAEKLDAEEPKQG